jgi:parvulin-like peptidyl-prolyl isomerase
MDAKATAEQFAKACAEASLTAKDSGPFLQEGAIPEIGKYAAFQRLAYALTEAKPLLDVPAYDAGTYFVACWLETIPGAEPKELDDVARQQVRDAILAEEGRAYYAKSVEIHRDALAGRSTAMDLMAWYEGQLEKEAGLSAAEKDKRREAFRKTIQDDVTPYYVPLQKKVRGVVFKPLDFEKDVAVTDEQVKAYYDEHPDDYQKKEVRARQIVANLPPAATAEQKEEKRGVLRKALEQVRAGTPFAEVAKELSEDPATKAKGGDLGFVAQGQRPPAVDGALFTLEPGQVSEVLETPGALTVLKVEEKREGRALADVQDEVRRKLTEEISTAKAVEAASGFADAFLKVLDEAQGSAAVPGEQFAALAQERSLEAKDSGYFSEGGMVVPLSYDPEVSKAFFQLSPDSPCSGAVKGRKEVLVGCWLETKPGELPKLDGNEQLLQRLRTKAKRDRAAAAARKRAGEAQAALAAALKEGRSFDEAAKGLAGIEFKTTEPFTRMRPATGIPDAQDLMEKLADTAPGTLLEPTDSASGTALVYLVSRTLPSAEKFAEERERYDNMARWSKRYAAIQEFYETLEKDSATVLNEPWKSMVENADRGGRGQPARPRTARRM